ncbi:MAG: Xaa-Pro peptidase family protein [Fimbriimonadaceae bacterium]
MNNLERLRARMAEANVSALFLSDITNVAWLTQFSGSFGSAIVTATDARFITDSRYRMQAGEQVKNLDVVSFASPIKFVEFLSSNASEMGVSKLWFESQNLSYSTYEQYRDALGFEFVSAGDLVSPLRKVKSADEIAKIKHVCGIADACFSHIQRMIQPGTSEYDVALEMEFFMKRQGASVAFDTIVASGWRGALPHGRASEKIIASGDLITFDFGACMDGYNSDITRTVAVGEPTERQREVYNQVLKSQLAALEMMKPGVDGADVDRKVREVMDEKGLSQYFGHGLGHGLGRLVHDSGRLSSTNREILEEGQVWTVEPGVYIDGWGGVRIEDDVVVTADGIEILTHSTKELLVL